MKDHTSHDRQLRTIAVALGAVAAVAVGGSLSVGAARGTSLNELQSQLGAAQSQVGSLTSSVSALQSQVATLNGQISLVQTRETAVRVTLGAYQARLDGARAAADRERAHVAMLRRRLAHARMILARQLVSSYENTKPDLVSVVLNARGFNDLLEQVDYLNDAERQQQVTIVLARDAKREALRAVARLVRLERSDAALASQTATVADGLAGMNALLSSREGAVSHDQAAQEAALALARAHGAQLRQAIADEQAQMAAAQRAQQLADANAAAAPASTATATTATSAAGATDQPAAGGNAPSSELAPSAGWAIPYSIVLCESGGQDLPPNGAGASGYYQIIPGTWRQFGGSGPAAYLAPKADQDAVASRIWDGGAGASNWVCSGIVAGH